MQVVLYHSNCSDGLIAAYEVWRTAPKETLCIPITYKEFQKQNTEEFIEDILHTRFDAAKAFSCFPFTKEEFVDVISGTPIFLVDICVDPGKLRALSDLFETVNVFDHHKSSWEMCEKAFGTAQVNGDEIFFHPFKNTEVYFSTKHSGAYYAYQQFHGTKQPPRYIQLVSDYDTWVKQYHDSDSFVAGIMGMSPMTMDELDEIISDGVDSIIRIGNYFNANRHKRSNNACKHRIEIDVLHEGKTYKAAIVNTNLDISSFVGNALVEDYGYDIGMSYCIDSDKEVGWSIRSKKSVDSTFLSESFGGGGHAQASGFSCSLVKFLLMIKDKRIVVT